MTLRYLQRGVGGGGAGFGIARSAPVGGSARRPGGGRPWVLESNFFENFSRKMAFFGDVCVEKIDFLGEKMDFFGKFL